LRCADSPGKQEHGAHVAHVLAGGRSILTQIKGSRREATAENSRSMGEKKGGRWSKNLLQALGGGGVPCPFRQTERQRNKKLSGGRFMNQGEMAAIADEGGKKVGASR